MFPGRYTNLEQAQRRQQGQTRIVVMVCLEKSANSSEVWKIHLSFPFWPQILSGLFVSQFGIA